MPLKNKKRRSFLDSVKDCINGLSFIMISEHNFKREVMLAIITLIISWYYVIKEQIIYYIIVKNKRYTIIY